MNRLGIALVISAPSGTGKTTLIKRLRKEFPNFGYSISCTTRAPREGEVDGKDYHFLSRERFLHMPDLRSQRCTFLHTRLLFFWNLHKAVHTII